MRQVIEFPSVGSTYHIEEYGVYEYSKHPRGSVLAGQERRVFIDCFDTLEEAQAKYPKAEWNDTAEYNPQGGLPSEPEEWFDPANAGECWSED